jgi:hypothetical protein
MDGWMDGWMPLDQGKVVDPCLLLLLLLLLLCHYFSLFLHRYCM